MTIVIDAMGGDHGPKVTIPASLISLEKHPGLHLILVGNAEAIKTALAVHRTSENDRLKIHHTTQEVAMDESPAHALRGKKDSSMRVAIDLVKEGAAQACVSAGNTGALMATARFVLKTLPGVDRPALMAALPTMNPNKDIRVLDLGANVDSSAENLYQFAVMGSAVASAIDNIPHPRVALLNIGEEEIKGNEQVKLTTHLLSEGKVVNYIGYVEGDGIFAGAADVVVCDGFVGNVGLKTAEGIVKLMSHNIKVAFRRSLYSRIVSLFTRPILRSIMREMDPGRRNGASLLGLQGTVIKSHGSANPIAFANAIDVAVKQVEKNIPELIREEVSRILKDSGTPGTSV